MGALALGLVATALVVIDRPEQGGDSVDPAAPRTTGAPRYVTAVEPGGRYFVDQYGSPVLVRGDSPWSLLVDLSPAQAETYFRTRSAQGFNAVIVSLLGATTNGGPSDDGTTFDGIAPFQHGDVLSWDDGYWARAHEYLERAAAHGITAFLYPVDGWTIGKVFAPTAPDDCREYGARVASWAADLPNVVWVVGGDYRPGTEADPGPSEVDRCFDEVRSGIRSQGDGRPFSIQFGFGRRLSTDSVFWAERVDWNFVYTYEPTYLAVRDARRAAPGFPSLLGEANYENENNDGGPPTTTATLRRQVLWALTSGSPGEFFGTSDWSFPDGWEERLGSEGALEVSMLRDVIERLRWWELAPDDAFVVSGQGTPAVAGTNTDVLADDVVSAATDADGTLALVFLPGPRPVTLDVARLRPGWEATWVDPSSGAESAAGPGPEFAPPGRNATGDTDWLLVLKADAPHG